MNWFRRTASIAGIQVPNYCVDVRYARRVLSALTRRKSIADEMREEHRRPPEPTLNCFSLTRHNSYQ